MEFENFKFSLTEYELDETVPEIAIDFPNRIGPTYRGEIELPDGVQSILFTEWTEFSGGEICSLLVVDPEAFLKAPELDDIEVNGYNVKELIRVAYRRLNIEQLI
ncbi:MAG: hypothetical protein K2L20_04105 [Ligilactobacillus sp.]|nr:hypothetical protein [Ligilactobacillus sp.]